MRYINKEYGFTFRPPFFDKFYEEKKDGLKLTEDNFPGKYMQGVGYDFSAINGAMIVGKNGTMWGVKVSCYNGRKWLDNDEFVQKMGASSANSEDGSFAQFSSGPLIIKWVKHNDQSLILQVSARKKLRVRVVFYPCYNFVGELSIEGSYVKGRSPYIGIVPGEIGLSDTNAVFKNRHLVILDDSDEKEFFMAQSYNKPSDSANGAFNEAIMEFVINEQQPSIFVYAAVGDAKILDSEVPPLHKVQSQIETAELRYGVNKTMGTGVLGLPTERMINSILWSRIYYPFLMTEIFSPQRTLLNKHFDIKGTEENCSAILGALAGIDKAKNQLKYTIEDKILAVLSLWHIYSHTEEKDKQELLEMFNKLKELYPQSSELVSAGIDKNMVAYKWSDSPLKERGEVYEMYSLDMSCLKLLAFDILERISVLLDKNSDRDKYEKSKKDMIQQINDVLWNEREGLYLNRYINGQWAKNYGATSFYPLICGAVDSGTKLSLLVNNLTNPKKFWLNYMMPTLSADNKDFGKKGKANNNGLRKPPFLEYRGSIVPYVNYIVYQGLARYGLDEIAGEFALKSSKLWSSNEIANVENYSMYLPNGKRYKAKEYLSSNGNMLAMIGVKELIDLEYFRNDLKTEALRFGTFVNGENSLTNMKILGKSYSIDVNDLSTMLIIDNEPVFKGEGGKFVVRNFIQSKDGCEFMIDAHSNITINIVVPMSKKSTKYFLIAPVGKSKIIAEGGKVTIQKI